MLPLSMGLSNTIYPSRLPRQLTLTKLQSGVQDVLTIHKAQTHDLLMSDLRWPSHSQHLERPKPGQVTEVD